MIPSAELSAARDTALPSAPMYMWDWRTRHRWSDFLKVLQARIGHFPKGISVAMPNDGEKTVPADLWALLLMGREIAIDALGYNPEQLSTDDAVGLLQGLTSILSRSNPREINSWLDSDN